MATNTLPQTERRSQNGKMLIRIDPLIMRSLFDYDPDLGTLRRRHRPDKCAQWNSCWAGKIAGSVGYNGYIRTRVNGDMVQVHRIIWCWVYGVDAPAIIDHIDGNGLNNKIKNLRECTHSQNLLNRKVNAKTASGYKGVSWKSGCHKWVARIKIDGKETSLGLFSTAEAAHSAYCQASAQHRGPFGRTA